MSGAQLELLPTTRPAPIVAPPMRVPVARNSRFHPYEPFDIEGLVEIVAELGAGGDWMTDREIFQASVMYPSDVSSMLDRLARLGVLEVEARIWCRNPVVAPDGYVVGLGHPEVSVMMRERTYQGYHNAYRLKAPAVRIEE